MNRAQVASLARTMAGPEEKAERYQKALVALVSDIQRSELTPLFKEGFLCAARCCDSQTPETMQAWSAPCAPAALSLLTYTGAPAT